MLFNSTYSENVKRQSIKVNIGCITLGDDGTQLTYTELMLKVQQLIKRSHVNPEKIAFQHLREEIDEFGHTEVKLYVYYERMETDAEYKRRMVKLQVKDLQEFYKMLAEYNSAVRQKKEIKKLFDKLGKTKSTPPYWMKEMLEQFFNHTNTVPESVQSEINSIYEDAVKYPQLALPQRQLEKLQKLVK